MRALDSKWPMSERFVSQHVAHLLVICKELGNWGDKGAAGATNLIDDNKRLVSAQLV